MDGLRWLLLLFGALVIAGVYFYTRREREKPAVEPVESPRITPTLGDGSEPVVKPPVDDASDDVRTDPEIAVATPQKIVTLRVVARNKGAFKGDELILSLRQRTPQ